jgi:hypothetical protein
MNFYSLKRHKVNRLVLDPLFVENANDQQMAFGGRLFDLPSYEGFFQTDREGRPKGVIALDPKEFIT